jgi:hypothetical protein
MREPRALTGLLCAVVLATAVAAPARAARVVDTDESSLDLGGDFKVFGVGVFPYEHLLMAENPSGQGIFDLRLKLEGSYGRWLRYGVHHQAAAVVMSDAMAIGLSPTAGSTASEYPQAVDLSWDGIETERFQLRGRLDRAFLTLSVPHFDLTLGRQPISFGVGMFFTPMDLVAPFSPVVIDQAYKPGMDSIRADWFIGMSGHIAVVAAYAGEAWEWDEMVLAAYGSATIGTTDIGVFAGHVHDDYVFGANVLGGIGPVGVHGEATITFKPYYRNPDLRAVIGATGRPHANVSVAAEIYLQTLGGGEPEDYLRLTTLDRFQRGELWAMGRWYAALSTNWQATPLIGFSAFAIGNLADGSFLVGPGMTWSLAANAELAVGGYLALGRRPDDMEPTDFFNPDFTPMSEDQILDAIPLTSEFGFYPNMAYVQLKTYF